MGKGDKKSKRGKIINGSYGVRRRKKKEKALKSPVIATKKTVQSKADPKKAEVNIEEPVVKKEAAEQVVKVEKKTAPIEVPAKKEKAEPKEAKPKAEKEEKPVEKAEAPDKVKKVEEDKEPAKKVAEKAKPKTAEKKETKKLSKE